LRLKRALGLPALILYGIILIQPTAPMPLFGAAAVKGQGHVATAVLIGMGRDNAIPRTFFAQVNARTRIPSDSIITVGIVALADSFVLSYSFGAELLNFGALVAFTGVNLCAFVHSYGRARRRTLVHLLPPVLGFAVCGYLWLSLGTKAKLAGLCWLGAGVLYGAWRTSCYRKPLEFDTLPGDETADEDQR
jgi:amino acid transporter